MRFIWLNISLALCSCGSPPESDSTPLEERLESEYIEEPALQEQFPDSGLLKSVDPEQIITDDWSDDGDLELETEEKK